MSNNLIIIYSHSTVTGDIFLHWLLSLLILKVHSPDYFYSSNIFNTRFLAVIEYLYSVGMKLIFSLISYKCIYISPSHASQFCTFSWTVCLLKLSPSFLFVYSYLSASWQKITGLYRTCKIKYYVRCAKNKAYHVLKPPSKNDWLDTNNAFTANSSN